MEPRPDIGSGTNTWGGSEAQRHGLRVYFQETALLSLPLLKMPRTGGRLPRRRLLVVLRGGRASKSRVEKREESNTPVVEAVGNLGAGRRCAPWVVNPKGARYHRSAWGMSASSWKQVNSWIRVSAFGETDEAPLPRPSPSPQGRNVPTPSCPAPMSSRCKWGADADRS